MNKYIYKAFLPFFSIFIFSVPHAAQANLCNPLSITPTHIEESIEMESERYSVSRGWSERVRPFRQIRQTTELIDGCEPSSGSVPTPCYIGTRDYNAYVLACNRQRTSDGNALNNRTTEERQFADNLPERFIRGTFRYFGIWPKPYFYTLKRVDGEWIVTSTLNFLMPEEDEGRIRLQAYLASNLSLEEGGVALNDPRRGVCREVNNREDDGFDLVDALGIQVCRVPIDQELFLIGGGDFLPADELGATESRPAIDWLMLHYRHSLETIWSRPGFKVEINIANFVGGDGEISFGELARHEREDVVYNISLHNNDEDNGRVYLPGPLQRSVYHTALVWRTIAHEYGHSLGLDDEYLEPGVSSLGIQNRGCDALSGFDVEGEEEDNTDFFYVMCNSTVGNIRLDDVKVEITGYHSLSQSIKSIYPWIITQRYPDVARCSSNSDCDEGEFCQQGMLVSRNRCRPQVEDGDRCSRDAQCFEGSFCNNKPIGQCQEADLLELGGACNRDSQCISDKCEGRMCVCREDHDCDPATERCATPVTAQNSCMQICRRDRDCTVEGERCRRPLGSRFRRCQ
jgi:hypothetical protein